MTIGQRIRKRRIELGLSQEELAHKLGNKSRASVCTVEKDKEDLTTDRINKYADALDCSVAYLLGLDDPVTEEQINLANDLMKPYLHKAIIDNMTDLDFDIIHSFMYASPDIKAAVMKLLDINT